MQRGGCVYIMTNKNNAVLYTGVTSNLQARVSEHKTKKHPQSFTAKYNCNKVVYYESYSMIEEAIAFEKQIKKRNRAYKEKLINEMNPQWNDLWEEIMKW